MVKLNKIYTRTGDDGATGLVGGARIAKHDLRMAAIGAVDETNATLGMVRAAVEGLEGLDAAATSEPNLREVIKRIQNDLFDLGADLATPHDPDPAPDAMPALRIAEAQVSRLEAEIDAINENLQPLTSFILPGGAQAAALLHLARTVCRRAEREMTALDASLETKLNPAAMQYINRLSDLLFVAARKANDNGAADLLWTPGGNR